MAMENQQLLWFEGHYRIGLPVRAGELYQFSGIAIGFEMFDNSTDLSSGQILFGHVDHERHCSQQWDWGVHHLFCFT
jgi:hypothetical protein